MNSFTLNQNVTTSENQLIHPNGNHVFTLMQGNDVITHITIKSEKEADGLFWGTKNAQNLGAWANNEEFQKGFKEGLAYFHKYNDLEIYKTELATPCRSYTITREQLLTLLKANSIWFQVDKRKGSDKQITIENPELDYNNAISVYRHSAGTFFPRPTKFELPADGFQLHQDKNDCVVLTNKEWDFYLWLSDTDYTFEILEHIMK